MEDIIKIVKSLEDSGLLLKGVSGTIQNQAIEQLREFISVLLGTLGATLLGNLLTGKNTIRAGKWTIIASYGSKRSFIKDF